MRVLKASRGVLGGIVALLLALGGLIGMAIPAHATEFDWNWKYTVNCDGVTIPFPEDLPSGQSGLMEVNFRFKQDGKETTVNYKLEGDAYKAKYPNGHAGQTVTIKWDDPLWRNGTIPKSGTWYILWLQVHGTNYHWEGSIECGTKPDPETVTGSLAFETLSCTEGSKNWAAGDGVPGGVFSFTDEEGTTTSLAIGEGYAGGIPEGLTFGAITVSLNDGSPDDDYSVTPWEGVWPTVDPESLNCETDPDPITVTGSVTTQVASCLEGSKNWLEATAVTDGVYTFTDEDGKTFETVAGEGYEGGVPDGLAFGVITVTLADAGSDPLTQVTPLTETWDSVNPETLVCPREDAIARVSFLSAATCDAPSTIEPIVYNATWLTTFQTEPGEYIAKAKANGTSTFIGGARLMSVPYVIDAPLGYQSLHPDEPCYKKPDTPNPTDTPSPNETSHPESTTDPSPSATPAPAASNGLAATGGTMPIGAIIGALVLMIVGGGAIRYQRQRNKTA